MNRELPDVKGGFRKGRGTRDQIASIRWIMEKAREFQKNIYFCFIDYAKAFDCVDCREPAQEFPPMTWSCGRALTGKASQGSRTPHRICLSVYPETRICFTILRLSPTPLTLTGGYPRPLFSEGNQLRALLISLLGIIGVFQSKLLRWLSNLPDRFTQTPTAMHTIVYSLPTARQA